MASEGLPNCDHTLLPVSPPSPVPTFHSEQSDQLTVPQTWCRGPITFVNLIMLFLLSRMASVFSQLLQIWPFQLGFSLYTQVLKVKSSKTVCPFLAQSLAALVFKQLCGEDGSHHPTSALWATASTLPWRADGPESVLQVEKCRANWVCVSLVLFLSLAQIKWVHLKWTFFFIKSCWAGIQNLALLWLQEGW